MSRHTAVNRKTWDRAEAGNIGKVFDKVQSEVWLIQCPVCEYQYVERTGSGKNSDGDIWFEYICEYQRHTFRLTFVPEKGYQRVFIDILSDQDMEGHIDGETYKSRTWRARARLVTQGRTLSSA